VLIKGANTQQPVRIRQWIKATLARLP